MRRWCRRQWTDHVSRGRREITRGEGGYVLLLLLLRGRVCITLTRLSPNPLSGVFRNPNAFITFSHASSPPFATTFSFASFLPRPYTLRIPPRTLTRTLHRQEAGGHPPRHHLRVHRALDPRRPRPRRRWGAPYPRRPCFHLLAHLRRLLQRAYTTGCCLCCRLCRRRRWLCGSRGGKRIVLTY